jgi:competence protein ComEA
MKPPELNQWQSIALGIVIGAAVMAAGLLISLPDRTIPLSILPTLTPSPLVIYLTGEVKSPGVLQVSPGSRIQDVVTASGGLLPEADIEQINLAAPVTDGQKIHIPRIGQQVAQTSKTMLKNTSPETDSTMQISLNKATQKELESLPGIGEEKASDIISEREKRGGFLSVDDLLGINGFSQKLIDQIRPYLYIE